MTSRFDETKVHRLPHGHGGGEFTHLPGSGTATLERITFRRVSGREFHREIAKARMGAKGPYLSLYSPAEYDRMKPYLSADGKTGGALKDHGDGRIEIVSLFNNGGPPGAGSQMLDHLLDEGGNYLEAYGPVLAGIYGSRGFERQDVYPFDPKLAAPDWDYAAEDSPDYQTMRLMHARAIRAAGGFDPLVMLAGESVGDYRARLRAWVDQLHAGDSPEPRPGEWEYLCSLAGIDPYDTTERGNIPVGYPGAGRAEGLTARGSWDPGKHHRRPKGIAGGGQFAPSWSGVTPRKQAPPTKPAPRRPDADEAVITVDDFLHGKGPAPTDAQVELLIEAHNLAAEHADALRKMVTARRELLARVQAKVSTVGRVKKGGYQSTLEAQEKAGTITPTGAKDLANLRRSVSIPIGLKATAADRALAYRLFDESKVHRLPKGAHGGGQFGHGLGAPAVSTPGKKAAANVDGWLADQGTSPALLRERTRQALDEATPESTADGMGWYERSRDQAVALGGEYGVPPRFALAAVAALSPRCVWDGEPELPQGNLGKARRVFAASQTPDDTPMTVTEKMWTKARAGLGSEKELLPESRRSKVIGTHPAGELTDAELAVFHPGITGTIFPAAKARAMRAARGHEQPDTVLGGLKIRSFFDNLDRPETSTEVTVDSHQIRAMLNDIALPDKVYAGMASNEARYLAFADAVRDVAKERGLRPNQVQAIMWADWKRRYDLGDRRLANRADLPDHEAIPQDEYDKLVALGEEVVALSAEVNPQLLGGDGGTDNGEQGSPGQDRSDGREAEATARAGRTEAGRIPVGYPGATRALHLHHHFDESKIHRLLKGVHGGGQFTHLPGSGDLEHVPGSKFETTQPVEKKQSAGAYLHGLLHNWHNWPDLPEGGGHEIPSPDGDFTQHYFELLLKDSAGGTGSKQVDVLALQPGDKFVIPFGPDKGEIGTFKGLTPHDQDPGSRWVDYYPPHEKKKWVSFKLDQAGSLQVTGHAEREVVTPGRYPNQQGGTVADKPIAAAMTRLQAEYPRAPHPRILMTDESRAYYDTAHAFATTVNSPRNPADYAELQRSHMEGDSIYLNPNLFGNHHELNVHLYGTAEAQTLAMHHDDAHLDADDGTDQQVEALITHEYAHYLANHLTDRQRSMLYAPFQRALAKHATGDLGSGLFEFDEPDLAAALYVHVSPYAASDPGEAVAEAFTRGQLAEQGLIDGPAGPWSDHVLKAFQVAYGNPQPITLQEVPG